MGTSAFPVTGAPPTARLDKARQIENGGPGGEGLGETKLQTQDNTQLKPPIYIYNICALPHVRNQPPEFPMFTIEPCEKGKKFSVKPFPGLVNERYVKPGTSEYHYKQVDGRKYATSLLNPSHFPGTDWRTQLNDRITGQEDMSGMDMNAFGVFWSELTPDDPALNEQIALFRKRADRTMEALVAEGNKYHAEGRPGVISGLMHFAMDYFGLSAPWHMSHRHKTECLNCGDLVLEGIAYHRNSSGDICIIDRERYEASVITAKQQKETGAEPKQAAERKPRTKAAG